MANLYTSFLHFCLFGICQFIGYLIVHVLVEDVDSIVNCPDTLSFLVAYIETEVFLHGHDQLDGVQRIEA